MTSITRSPLLEAATSTVESLALLLPEPTPSEGQLSAPLARRVRVRFAGPLRGAVEVRATDDVARAVAANMLGVDAADDPRLVQDALGEVANVICGNLLPELAGRAAVFHLGAPAPVTPAESAADAPALAIVLGVDDGRAEVALYVDGAPPAPPGADPAAPHTF